MIRERAFIGSFTVYLHERYGQKCTYPLPSHNVEGSSTAYLLASCIGTWLKTGCKVHEKRDAHLLEVRNAIRPAAVRAEGQVPPQPGAQVFDRFCPRGYAQARRLPPVHTPHVPPQLHANVSL